MERLHCPTCGNEVFFDSLRCVRSDTALAVEVDGDGSLSMVDADLVAPCSQRAAWRCNWVATVADDDRDGASSGRCASCRSVDAGDHAGNPLLATFQLAQRRALAQLSALGVGWHDHVASVDRTQPPLRFAYRSRSAGDAATIGHLGGTITLDLDEADPAKREQIRATLGEQYRTPLGHLRHELGHFVWQRHVATDQGRLDRFREVFGDERSDYRAALDAHYARLDDGAWRDEHVSSYAAAHPWEDFAESWAQVMHVHDVVATGVAWGVVPARGPAFDPAAWMLAAVTASLAANELARAMGARDLYPFTLSPGARRKIELAWQLVHGTAPAAA